MGVTLDNASNNNTFMRLLANWSIEKNLFFDGNFHFRCFAHIINLAVHEALSCLDQEISKVKLFVYF
jgi:hypothetical protein